MSDAEQTDPLPTEDPPEVDDAVGRRQRFRVAIMAITLLACFALAMYAMLATRSGAVIVVEADEVATVYVKTGGITLHEVDGAMILTLQLHRNAVKAGEFRVEGGEELEISSGRLLEIKRNDVIHMKITSPARE